MTISATRARPPVPRLTAVVAGLLLLGTLTACSASNAAGTSSGSEAGAVAAAPHAASGAAKVADSGTTSGVDRAITYTGSLILSAADPVRTAADITSIVEGAGGRVDSSSEHPTSPATAELRVRIPSAVFESTLAQLKRTGAVRNASISATDVTDQVKDYAIEVAGLRASVTRLQQLLGKASTTTDLVAIETSLTDRENTLEQTLAQQKELADQVSYATLSISIGTPATVHDPAPSTFGSGFAAGWTALVATAAALTVGFGVALPWLVVIGVLLLLVLPLVRRFRKRARSA